MNKKYQIFVSSTYKDLKEERQIAIDTIMKLRHIPAGMELFSATGENQFETIKPIIYESDYYLLILAGKYGSLCEETGMSYTEMEYDYAIQNNKRVIAFVYDDPDNLPIHLRENKDKMRKKLEKFRTKVMSNKMVKIWHDRIELLQGISISISTVIEMYPAKTCWLHVNENDIYTPINEYVELNEKVDFNIIDNIGTYFNNIAEKSLTLFKIAPEDKKIILKINLPAKNDNSFIDEFAGFYIRMDSGNKDWSRYVLNDYYLTFFYNLKTDMNINMWFEVKGQATEMIKYPLTLKSDSEEKISIHLKEYLDDIDNWKKVKEICFVFRPDDRECICDIMINDIFLEKRLVEK